MSINGDTVKLSDNELSIVESDGGHQDIDTPANPYLRKKRNDSFNDAANRTQHLHSASKVTLKSKEGDESLSPYRQSKTMII